MFLLDCKTAQEWFHPCWQSLPEALNWAFTGLVKVHPSPVCLTSPFLLLLSLVSVSAALSFVSGVGGSAWEFSHYGLGVAAKTKRNITPGGLPSDSSSGSRTTPVGKSSKAEQDPEEVCLPRCLPAHTFSPSMFSVLPLFTRSSHLFFFLSQRLNLLLMLIHPCGHRWLCCFFICLYVMQVSSVSNQESTPMRITFNLIVSVIISILRGVTKAYSWSHPWGLGMELLLWYHTWLLLNRDLEDRKLNNARLIYVPGKWKIVVMNLECVH